MGTRQLLYGDGHLRNRVTAQSPNDLNALRGDHGEVKGLIRSAATATSLFGPLLGVLSIAEAARRTDGFTWSDPLSTIRHADNRFTHRAVFTGLSTIGLAELLRKERTGGMLGTAGALAIGATGATVIGMGVTKGRLSDYHLPIAEVFFALAPVAILAEAVEGYRHRSKAIAAVTAGIAVAAGASAILGVKVHKKKLPATYELFHTLSITSGALLIGLERIKIRRQKARTST